MRIDNAALIPYAPPPAVSPGRALVPVGSVAAPVAVSGPRPESPADAAAPAPAPPSPYRDLIGDIDVRSASPRQMAETSLDLYAGGLLNWDEYSRLAFQPELHPDFDRTIGALTGETARPDQPRDYVAEWEDRLAFEQRHNPSDSPQVRHTERIAAVLRQLATPFNVVV